MEPTSPDTEEGTHYKEFGDSPEEANKELLRSKEEQLRKENEEERKEILEAINQNMNRLGNAMQNTLIEVMTGTDPTLKKDGDK